jgi:epoxyqueuosine reductase
MTVTLAAQIEAEARRLGFAAVGFAPATQLPGAGDRLRAWLDRGCAGTMAYLSGSGARDDPSALLASARTVITVAMAHADAAPPAEADGPTGRIARYARGADYHTILARGLRALADFLARATGARVAWRACVDTAPLLERELAAGAGLGFVAKNAMLITPGVGSYTLLGELLTDLVLTPGTPIEPRCGRCTACITACPTGAIVADRVVDARRCISYLTIELDGPIPRELRPLIGDWVFGCDLCQEVCPFNHGTSAALVPLALSPRPAQSRPGLRFLLGLNTSQFKKLVRRTALRRVRRRQLLRNAAVALGNVGGHDDLPVLQQALADRAPLVRGHAAWALGRLGGRATLLEARERESDPYVQEEIAVALSWLLAEPPRG